MIAAHYLGRQVQISDCVHSQTEGQVCTILEGVDGFDGECILRTDLRHPEDPDTFLWVNENQVKIIE
jgi:hypothetical protein